MHYIRKLFYMVFCLPLFLFGGEEGSPFVLVSVAPHKYYVEKIAGGTVKVELMVPAGASSHTYEPTPKKVLSASHADLWFQVGENFEARAAASLKSYNPKLQLVNLQDNLPVIYHDDDGHRCHHYECCDPHIWLSPKMAKIQANTIAEALSKRYPANKDLYKRNLKVFQQELDALDIELKAIFEQMKNRTVMVSHPAYAYLARDYQFKQLSLECEGKDPTPLQLTQIVNEARKNDIKVIFIQEQLSSKGAKRVANLLDADVVILDPYDENFPENLRHIARSFSRSE